MIDSTIPEAPSWKGQAPLKQRFGIRLHDLRMSRGYTQMKFAMLAKIDRSYVSDIERGVKEPALTKIGQIAEAFSMTVSELFEDV